MNGTISLQSKLKGAVSMANTIINGGASPYPKTVGPAAIASFSDGAQDAPLKSLVFDIEPKQDLNGYDYPWPAGGGVNLLPPIASDQSVTRNNLTVTLKTDGTLTIVGKLDSGTTFFNAFTLSGTVDVDTSHYIYLFNNSNSSQMSISFRNSSSTTITSAVPSEANRKVAFTASGTVAILGVFVNSTGQLNMTMKPMIAKSNSVTAWTPYTNICPISGWTQANGKHSGADMTDYTPITIPLGQTVYGGTLDVIRGKLVIDRAMDTITSNSAWCSFATGTGNSSAVVQLAEYQNCKYVDGSSSYNGAISSTGGELQNYWINPRQNEVPTGGADLGFAYSNGGQIRFHRTDVTNITDLASFKAAFPETQIVYYLATPQEYDVTPQTIKTLLGVNNIWADSGDTTLEYYPAAASIVSVLNRSSKVYTSIPLGKIRYETYQITPQQTIDLDSHRSENGNLLRNPVATKCKIEFNTPLMTDSEWADVWRIIKAGFNNNTERKLKLRYYDTLSATYKTGYFYVPDVQTTIRNIEEGAGVINYNEIRIAFIEY